MGTCFWDGYEFRVYSPDTKWNDVGGLYIFAKRNQLGKWITLYAGQTGSFRDRLSGHERWAEAERQGATHIHARVEEDENLRILIEAKLIKHYTRP